MYLISYKILYILFNPNPNRNPRNLRKENPYPNLKNPRKEIKSFFETNHL